MNLNENNIFNNKTIKSKYSKKIKIGKKSRINKTISPLNTKIKNKSNYSKPTKRNNFKSDLKKNYIKNKIFKNYKKFINNSPNTDKFKLIKNSRIFKIETDKNISGSFFKKLTHSKSLFNTKKIKNIYNKILNINIK